MISLPRSVPVFVFRKPTDMRKSFDTLAALLGEQVPATLLSGAIFVFLGRDRRRAKALFFDGTGVCVLAKRLARGRFANVWSDDATPLRLTASELSLLLEGSAMVGRVALSPSPIDTTRDVKMSAEKFSTPLDTRAR